jgi:copper oxidase (laccase) domain-containing protein
MLIALSLADHYKYQNQFEGSSKSLWTWQPRAFALRFIPMMQTPCYLNAINAQPGVRAGFLGRIPDIAVDADRAATLQRLRPAHEVAVQSLGFKWSQLHRAEQVHGAKITVVKKHDPPQVWPGVDALVTADPDVLLGIYVADCGAVYICDPVQGILALFHSGKKGTEKNITAKTIALMSEKFGTKPEDLLVALAPCIRPPAYEVDFAHDIRNQAIDAGVPDTQFSDAGICTSSDLDAYYSYRVEKGNTGRMLALLGRML